jgi:hypothetical protein
MLVMQQLTSLTRLSVFILFNPPAHEQDLCCAFPPQLKLLCIHDLHLYRAECWLPALIAVSEWVGRDTGTMQHITSTAAQHHLQPDHRGFAQAWADNEQCMLAKWCTAQP